MWNLSTKAWLVLGALTVASVGYFAWPEAPTQKELFADLEFEHSLKIHDRVIKGYRSPASLKAQEATQKKAKSASSVSPKDSAQSAQANLGDSLADSTEGISGAAGNTASTSWNPSTKPQKTVTAAATGTTFTNQGNPAAPKTAAPAPTTTAKSSKGSSSSTTNLGPPTIKGRISPLDGVIAAVETPSLVSRAYANVCTDPRVLLMDLTNMSVLLDNPIDEEEIDSSTSFEFDPVDLGLELDQPNRYMLQTLGCQTNFQRIITSFYDDQDIDKTTTLVSKTINTRIAPHLMSVSAASLKTLYKLIEDSKDPGDDFETLYNKLDLSPTLKQTFQSTFNGGATSELKDAAPDISASQIHRSLNEKAGATFFIAPSHWDSSYVIAQEWQIDGVTQSTTASWTYAPGANSKASQTFTLLVGHKSVSDASVDRSRPYHEVNFTVTTTDTHPALAPALSLAATSTDPSATRSLTLDVATGALVAGVYDECETFSEFAIVEDGQTPTDLDFIYECDAGPVKTLNYSVARATDGPLTLRLFTRDERGSVSATPATETVHIDTTAPTVTFTGLQASYGADTNATFNWTTTETHITSAQNFTVELFNGSTWSTIGSVPASDGPLANQSFSVTHQLPNIAVNNAKIRVTVSDLLGQQRIQESNTFSILQAVLTPTPTVAAFGSIANKTDSSNLTVTVSNTGPIASKLCAAASLSGTHAADFSIVSDSCAGTTIAPAAQCQIVLKAHPNAKGARSAGLNLTCVSDILNMSLTATSLNNPPQVIASANVSTLEETPVDLNFGAITDHDGDPVSYTVTVAPGHGTISNCLVAAGNYVCTYTPNLNYQGSDLVTFKANDGTVDSSAGNFLIDVVPLNDAPTLTATQTVSTNEDTVLNFNLNAANDVDGDALTYTLLSSPASGTLSCAGGTSTACTYTPANDFEGSVTFTYRASDGFLNSGTATVTINVTAQNDPPVVAADQSLSTPEDTALNFTISAASDIDVPAQTLGYKLITLPTKGVISGCVDTTAFGTDRSCVYTPNADATGTDSFTYRVSDGLADSSTVATITITITAVNDAPTVAATQAVSVDEDTVLNFDLTAGSDTENDVLTYVRLTGTASGTVSCSGGTSRSCTYTPNANFNGTDSFTYRVNDGASNSNTATVTITVNPVNDPPVMAVDQTASTNDNTTLVITLPAASDVDGDALTYKIVTPPTHGTLTNCITTGAYGTDRVCDYVAHVNYHGSDSFTYVARDALTDALTVTMVTIDVTDATPAPAPTVSLISDVYTNVTTVNFTAVSCSDVAELFVNQGAAPAAGAAGWQNCDTTPGIITFTLPGTQGAQSLKVWSKDSHDNVSASSTDFTVYYDTVAPVLSLANPGSLRGGASVNLAWTATESYSSAALNFTVEAFDGTNWSTVGTTAATTGALSATAFGRTWSVPTVNTTAAAFRVSFTDRAGNSAQSTSTTFTIDSTAPVLTIATPANNSFHGASTTLTGVCEAGRSVTFSGDIQTSFSIACPAGSYSQLVNFSNGDGNKLVYVEQSDAVGNTTTLSINLVRDEVSPILARTSGVSPDFTQNDTPNAWGGTCEGNYTISVTGDETTSFGCSSGTWSWTPAPKTVDGVFTYNLVQTDAAGNTSAPPLSLSWQRDATPPVFTLDAPVVASATTTINYSSNLNAVTLSGACEGTNVIQISGASSGAISCSSSSWQWTTATFTSDGTRSYTFTQRDAAGNEAVLTFNWTRDTSGPMLTLTKNLEKSNADTVTFSGNCETGVDVVVGGTESQTVSCPAGTWSYTSGSYTSDATRAFTFQQTFTSAPFNSTSLSASWIRETDRPLVTSFTTSAPNPNRSSYIPIDLTASSQNPAVAVSHVCFRVDTTTAPAANNNCFIAVNSPEIGQAPGQHLVLSNYYTLMGWTPKDYYVYVWVKDEAGNVSELTGGGNGSEGTDLVVKEYTPGTPPTIWDVVAANVVNPPLPPTRTQSEVPAGSDVYIRWKATDNNPLPAGAISIFYTSDEINFNTVAANLDTTDINCGTALAANEGCYRWVGGSPLNSAYKIRVKVTDNSGVSTQSTSNPLNLGSIKILAGNTESGLGGSAQTAMFFTRRFNNEHPDPSTLVVSRDGRFFFADYKRGVLTIDQQDGKQKIFIPATGVSSGDGGPAVNATLQFAAKITLDYQNRLLIHDRDRIRRVDLKAEVPTIETIIGGGADTSDTVANPRDVLMTYHGDGDWASATMVFSALPNGDIYFQSDYAFKEHNLPTFRLRVYSAATGQVTARHFGGVGDAWKSDTEILKCRVNNPGIRFNSANSSITGVTAYNWYESSWPGCSHPTGNIVRAHFDPNTFQAIASSDDGYRWWQYSHYTGMDGNLYVHVNRQHFVRKNFDGTYTNILGQGTQGVCADGTAATDCMMDLMNVFITPSGKLYFTDRGVIRTLDANGNVKTLFGQSLSYGDGVNALNARLNNVTKTYLLASGKIMLNDGGGSYIKEFSVEGNINILAGDGTSREATANVTPTASSIFIADMFVADPATGDFYTWYKGAGYGSYLRFNRSTGLLEHVVGNIGGGTHYTTADGLAGLDVQSTNWEHTRGIPLGFANGKLVTSAMQYMSNGWENGMLKTYDATDSFRQAHLAGNIGPGAGGRSLCDATTAVPANTCFMPHWDTLRDAQWDPVLGRWITAIAYGGSHNQVYEIYPGGNIRQIFQTVHGIHSSFLFRREGSDEILYYCNGSRIRKVNLTTQTELGDLPWSMPNLSCRGFHMSYNAANNSIIFPFEQNGLFGVAEYFLP